MKKMKKTTRDETRTLTLARETLRVLTPAELGLAVGGVDRTQPFRSYGCQL